MKNSKFKIAKTVILRTLPKDLVDYTARFFAFAQNDFISRACFKFFNFHFEFTKRSEVQ